MNYLGDAGLLLLNTAFGLLLGLLLVRIALQALRANFYNPVCQAIYKATNPILMPLQRVVPVRQGVHWPGLVLCWLLAVVWMWLQLGLGGAHPGFGSLLVLGIAKLLDVILVLMLILIVLRALMSFLGGSQNHPVVPLLVLLTDPLMRPVQRVVPPLGGFDFSPVVAILAITLTRMLVVRPLFDFALSI